MAKVLIVVDYQNDFVKDALGFEAATKLEDAITGKIEEYAQNCSYVICTLDTHKKNYLATQEGRKLPVEHCIIGTTGWELYGKVKRAANNAAAVMINKETFGSGDLLTELHRIDNMEKRIGGGGITEIEICGVVSNMCVISNAVIAKAALPEANIKILSKLCSSFDMDLHEAAMKVMESMQMEIVN